MSPRLVTGLALSLLVGGCAVNPVTHRPQLMLVSEEQERELGREADQEIVAQYGLLQEPRLVDYARELGQRLVAVSHRKQLEFQFRVLDDPIVNAFALPGGYVYLTRGILAYLDSEAALAGVLGHEVGHVTARHGAQRMSKQILAGIPQGAIGLISERLAGTLSAIGRTATALVMLKFSRDDERQSDELGVEYASALGYDTRDMAAFFAALGRLSDQGGSRLPSWASTHPDPGERHERILELGAAQPPRELHTRRAEYLARIDGLVFGADPRQGYVEGGRFLHPELRLAFPVPAGWQVQNSRAEVVLAPADGDLAVVFALAAQATPGAAADAFAAREGIRTLERADVSLGGLPAVRLVCEAPAQGGGTLSVLATFTALEGRVYQFLGLAVPARLEASRAALLAPAEGFAALSDPQALAVKPVRLRVVQAPEAGSFQQVVARWPIPSRATLSAEGLAILNGVALDAPVEAGRLLKVLVAE